MLERNSVQGHPIDVFLKICFSGKFLLAGRFGQNNISLEIGKLWVSEVLATACYLSETS